MTEKLHLRFRIEESPTGCPFENGFVIHDMKNGSCLAHMASESDALYFLEMKGRQSDPKNWREGLYDPQEYEKKKIVNRVVEALSIVFRDYLPKDPCAAKDLLRKYVHTGKGDPGQWSPNALAVVNIESLEIPGNEEVRWIEQWVEASDLLGDAGFEQVNSAIVAVYPW